MSVQTVGNAGPSLEEEKLLDREELYNQFMDLSLKANSAKNLRQFLQGVVLKIEGQGVKVRVFAPKNSARAMSKNGVDLPFLFFDMNKAVMAIQFQNN